MFVPLALVYLVLVAVFLSQPKGTPESLWVTSLPAASIALIALAVAAHQWWLARRAEATKNARELARQVFELRNEAKSEYIRSRIVGDLRPLVASIRRRCQCRSCTAQSRPYRCHTDVLPCPEILRSLGRWFGASDVILPLQGEHRPNPSERDVLRYFSANNTLCWQILCLPPHRTERFLAVLIDPLHVPPDRHGMIELIGENLWLEFDTLREWVASQRIVRESAEVLAVKGPILHRDWFFHHFEIVAGLVMEPCIRASVESAINRRRDHADNEPFFCE